jgi:acetylornithine deacetylase/succinyl-diaminopimelate desuccinylase-like protein
MNAKNPSHSMMEGFTAEQERWLDVAWDAVDPESLRDLAFAMTAIPSPTGQEHVLATYLVEQLRNAGVEAHAQSIDAEQANAVGRVRGDGSGASLLLFAPIDTPLAANRVDDGPWADPDGTRADLRPNPSIENGCIVGLGAANPKGHAACIVAAARAIRAAGVPLRGDLLIGLAAGGMPVMRMGAGLGSGCAYMLDHDVAPDFAVIAKPGRVANEEVGLCWLKVTIRGSFNYAGRPRTPAQRNPILDAASVIGDIENWLPAYTAENTSGCVAPLGCITAIEAGWPNERLAFSPAEAHVFVDLRVSPRTSPMDAKRQFDAALERIAHRHGINMSSELIAAIPGTSTPVDNWIVQASVRSWERVVGQAHDMETRTSGVTDANILRAHGIPTARIGMPSATGVAAYRGIFSMGVVSLDAMVTLTRTLIAVAIDTCTRTAAEVGL